MDFMHVLIICIGGIFGCAALVFAIETLVAFCFHDVDTPSRAVYEAAVHGPVLVEEPQRELDVEKAA